MSYTILNILIVTNSASYVATQVSGNSSSEAWRNAVKWVDERYDSGADDGIDTSSPVFIKEGKMAMEQHSVGELRREARRIRESASK